MSQMNYDTVSQLTDLVSLFVPQQNQRRRSQKDMLIDIYNDDSTMIIYAELPGVPKEHFNVDFYNNKLTISAEKIKPQDTFDLSEITYGKIERTLTLPFCVTKKETVTLSSSNGVLKIKINKLVEETNKFTLKIDDS